MGKKTFSRIISSRLQGCGDAEKVSRQRSGDHFVVDIKKIRDRPWVVLLSSDGDRESEIRGMSPPVVVLGHQPGPFVNNARYLGVVWCFGWG